MEAEKEGAREEGRTAVFIPVKSGYSEHQSNLMVRTENSKKANMHGGGRGGEDSSTHLP